MEEIKLEEIQKQEEDNTIIEFTQELNTEDLIEYNNHLLEKKSKYSLLIPTIGLFVVVMGIVDLFDENPNILSGVLYILVGLFLMFGFRYVTVALQKKTIRKQLINNVRKVVMNVKVYNEGIRFEIPEEEQEEEKPKEEVELTNDELRELERNNIEEEPKVEEEVKEEEKQQPQPNAITVPWGGIVKLEDTEKYLFVNMVGYQALFIKKESCENLEEVITYAKEKLNDSKRFVEIKK